MESRLKISALRALHLFEINITFKFVVEQLEYYIAEDIRMEEIRKGYPNSLTIACALIIFVTTPIPFVMNRESKSLFSAICLIWLIATLIIVRKRVLVERKKLLIQAKRLVIAENLRKALEAIDLLDLHHKVLNDENVVNSEVIHALFQSVREIILLQVQDLKCDCTIRLRTVLFTITANGKGL